jgi:methionyl-tRNA synthetase
MVDAIARFQKLAGKDVTFLTGTDEHAKKVADAAAKAGKSTKEFVDMLSDRFKAEWDYLNIHPTRFIRTSDPDHAAAVTEVFNRLLESGDIYKGEYSGWYSVTDETRYADSEVADGFAIETKSPVERVTEENYFFKLSAYTDRLLEKINSDPDFLMPDTRRNEVIAFINEGLRDVPISRRSFGWGIPVPVDPTQTIYVWFDALINYLTATGWPNNPDWDKLWPADAHVVGKEIYTRFHATLWPAMLMGLNIPLPKHVVGHGWWLIAGEKGSKSKGNIPTSQEAVAFLRETVEVDEQVAIDSLRYYLLRDISFTSDSEFAYSNWISRYNGELANDLGNLLNRSLNMLLQYRESVIPEAPISISGKNDVARLAVETVKNVIDSMEQFNPGAAIESISRFVAANNKAIDTAAPWKKAKEGDNASVDEALYTALEACRVISILIAPFIPYSSAAFRRQLGLPEDIENTLADETKWGQLKPGYKTGTAEPLFPRVDKAKLAQMTSDSKSAKESKKMSESVQDQAATIVALDSNTPPPSDTITIDDFVKVQLRTAKIMTAEPIEGAKKLLRLTVDCGDAEPRQLVAGIAESYAPEDLPGKSIIIVANLAPANIRGVESNGMLLAATDSDGKAVLLTPERDLGPGMKIK